MHNNLVRTFFRTIILLLGLGTGAVAQRPNLPDTVKVVKLDSLTCRFFAAQAYTPAEFFAFLPESKYLRINREHMYVAVSDRGEWKQAEDGTVTLKSSEHYKNIEYEGLEVYLWHRGPGKILDEIENAITAFLANNKEQEFTTAQVAGIYKYNSPTRGYTIEGISIDWEISHRKENIKRKTLEGLLAAIESYKKDGQSNEFRLIPLDYTGRIFLLWYEHELPMSRDLKGMMKDIDSLGGDKNKFPPYFFVQIDKDSFIREAGTTQPFMFYTEMNEREKPTLPDAQIIGNLCPNP